MIHALLIDPVSRSISPVVIEGADPDNWSESACKHIDCEEIEEFDWPDFIPEGHILVADENGGIRKDRRQRGKFDVFSKERKNGPILIIDSRQILGKALLVRDVDGYWADATVTELEIAAIIEFFP